MDAMETEVRTPHPQSPALHVRTDDIGSIEPLDAPASLLAALAGRIGPGRLKDALSGTWLGHALHPLLTDIPIGTWTSATLLDVLGGEEAEEATERLIGVGLLAALPTAVTGATDWADSQRADAGVRRVGVVHAMANTLALGLFGASLAARRRGNVGRGKALSLAGMSALMVGGHLGGHLSYARGIGVDQRAFDRRPGDWQPVGEGDLADGEHRVVEVEGVQVLVGRDAGRLYALANACNHRGGPLNKGTFEHGCVTCPWHGSVFRLEDGSVVRGPAAYPQAAYEVRAEGARIEVRAAS